MKGFFFLLKFYLGVILLLPGCVAFQRDPENKKGPKTLFTWAEVAKEEKKDSQHQVRQEAEADEDEIVTDRPDFTEASSTVGKGRFQLEAGYTFQKDGAEGSLVNANSYPEMLFRIGCFADWFELRVGQNFINELTTSGGGKETIANGPSDLYLGAKLWLTEQKGGLPETAIVFQMTVPTGDDSVTGNEILPGINFLYGWDVIEDFLSIGASTQGNKAHGSFVFPVFGGVVDSGLFADQSYMLFAQSVTVNYTLTKKLGMFTEGFGLFPVSAVVAEVGPEYYLDGGFTYKFTPMFQYDIRAGVGLNRHASDLFAGTGFSVKY